MTKRRGVLSVGDRIRFDGEEHTVITLSGTTIRVQATAGTEAMFTLSALMARRDLGLVDARPRPELHRIGLLDSLPDDVKATALLWERHVIEVETGLPPDAPADAAPRSAYDPATTTLAQREVAKAAELTAAGTPTTAATVQRMRLRHAKEGVWGLVDHRRTKASNPLGRADPRVVAAIAAALEDETNESTGTRDRLRRRVRLVSTPSTAPGPRSSLPARPSIGW